MLEINYPSRKQSKFQLSSLSWWRYLPWCNDQKHSMGWWLMMMLLKIRSRVTSKQLAIINWHIRMLGAEFKFVAFRYCVETIGAAQQARSISRIAVRVITVSSLWQWNAELLIYRWTLLHTINGSDHLSPPRNPWSKAFFLDMIWSLY